MFQKTSALLVRGFAVRWYRSVYKMRVLLRLGETLLRGLFIKKRKRGKERSRLDMEMVSFQLQNVFMN